MQIIKICREFLPLKWVIWQLKQYKNKVTLLYSHWEFREFKTVNTNCLNFNFQNFAYICWEHDGTGQFTVKFSRTLKPKSVIWLTEFHDAASIDLVSEVVVTFCKNLQTRHPWHPCFKTQLYPCPSVVGHRSCYLAEIPLLSFSFGMCMPVYKLKYFQVYGSQSPFPNMFGISWTVVIFNALHLYIIFTI